MGHLGKTWVRGKIFAWTFSLIWQISRCSLGSVWQLVVIDLRRGNSFRFSTSTLLFEPALSRGSRFFGFRWRKKWWTGKKKFIWFLSVFPVFFWPRIYSEGNVFLKLHCLSNMVNRNLDIGFDVSRIVCCSEKFRTFQKNVFAEWYGSKYTGRHKAYSFGILHHYLQVVRENIFAKYKINVCNGVSNS